MANTITSKVVIENQRQAVIYITLASDGSNETGTVIYDSSAIASAIGITDPLNSQIMEIHASSGAASTARIKLLWDATTDVLAYAIPAGFPIHHCFHHNGNLPNTAGTGKTGDILLTTTGLASGDAISLVLRVRVS